MSLRGWMGIFVVLAFVKGRCGRLFISPLSETLSVRETFVTLKKQNTMVLGKFNFVNLTDNRKVLIKKVVGRFVSQRKEF